MLPVVVAIAVLAIGCVLYGIFIERFRYQVLRHRLDILPAGASPFVVLHLSDLHFVRRDQRKTRFLAGLPEADITVVTGDFLGEPEAVETAAASVRAVRGRIASWFVLGSNDYFVPRPKNYLAYFRPRRRRRRRAALGRAPDLIRALVADGWHDLTDSRRAVSLHGLEAEVLGLDDAHIGRHDLRVAPRSGGQRFGVAVMHSPDTAPEAAALGYELIVAGHTHGGQVRLPWIGALVSNCSIPPRLASGLVRMGSAILHTSRGLGTSKYAPFRFWCRPEATFLELRPRTATPSGDPLH